MISKRKFITGIYNNKNLNENIVNTISKYSKNICLDKSLKVDISRNVSSSTLNLNSSICNVRNNLLPVPTLQFKYAYSTTKQYIIKNGNNNSFPFGVIDIPKNNLKNNEIVNTICFSTYNKRFMSSLHKLNNSINNIDEKNHSNKFIGQYMTYTTETETEPVKDSNEKINSNTDTIPNNEQTTNSQNSDNKTKEKQVTFKDLVKEYGIIAILVYLSLAVLYFIPTLAVVLYYDLDPDELYRKSKDYISHLGKKVINKIKGKVEYIEETLEEAKQKKLERESKEQLNPETDENGNPIDKKKKLYKTVVMSYALAQVITPPKTVLTIMITPYVAKILRKAH